MMAQVGHLPFYLNDARCEVVAVAEERPSLVGALADRLGAERVLRDRHSLLQRSDVDAIVLSAPRAATGPLTLEAIEAGKHVLAEKPMAHTVEQATNLVEAARARQRLYAVGFMKRYDPGVQRAKALVDEMVASRRLGNLLCARFYDYSKSYAMAPPPHVRPRESRAVRYPVWPTWPDWLPARHRGAYERFLNAACHDVNLIGYFFPGPVGVTSALAGPEGVVAAAMRWENIPILLEIAMAETGRWLEGAEFLFERGRIALSIPSPMAVNCVSNVELDDLHAGIRGQPVQTGRGWCFERQAAAFVDALVDGVSPLTPGEVALADMQLVESIWRHVDG
jgi:predicted dehydrogenase